MAITLPVDLLDPLTEDDLDRVGAALNGTRVRFELDNGRLILMPPGKSWHAHAAHRTCNLLENQGRLAYLEQGIRLGARRVRFPDVAAFVSRPDPDADRHDPALFTLIAEVVSPDSEEDDRLVKPRLYAAARVPEYWLIDRHPSDKWDAIVDVFVLGERGDTSPPRGSR